MVFPHCLQQTLSNWLLWWIEIKCTHTHTHTHVCIYNMFWNGLKVCFFLLNDSIVSWLSCNNETYKLHKVLLKKKIFLRFIFGVLPLLWYDSGEQTGSEVGEGTGSGKVLEPRFELGTPITQWRYMSAHLPTRLSAWTKEVILNRNIVNNI